MGPDGGNGGRGGDLSIVADDNVFDLYKFKKNKPIKAENGFNGGKNNKSGKNGKELLLKVPTGTELRDSNNALIKTLEEKGQKFTLKGGQGGRGNKSFASSVNRSPRKTTKGKPGEEKSLNMNYFIPCDTAIISNTKSSLSVHEKLTGRNYEKIMPNYPIIGVKVNKMKENEKILLIPNIKETKDWLHQTKNAKKIIFIGNFKKRKEFNEIKKELPKKSKIYTYKNSSVPIDCENIENLKKWPN